MTTWFHTIALPLLTVIAMLMGAKAKMPSWKYVALATGCGAMLAGLWTNEVWSTPVIIAGAVLLSVGIPRRTLTAPK